MIYHEINALSCRRRAKDHISVFPIEQLLICIIYDIKFTLAPTPELKQIYTKTKQKKISEHKNDQLKTNTQVKTNSLVLLAYKSESLRTI